MLTCFSKSSSRLTDRSTLMSSVSCPSNSEIGQYDHWVPRWRVSCMSAVVNPLFCWHPWITSPVLTFPRCLYVPLRFFYCIFCNFSSRFLHDAIFSLIDSIPHSVSDSCKSCSSIVIRRSKYVLSSSLFRPSRQAVLWSTHTFDFMNGHIFITYLNYNTKKQTTSFRSRDDDDADLERLRNSSSQLIPSMT